MAAPAPHKNMSDSRGPATDAGSSASAGGPAAVLLIFAWFALTAGLGEAGVLLVRRYVFHRLTWTSIHAVWMAPVANLALLALPALGLALLARLRRDLVPTALLTGALAFFTSMMLLEVAANGGLALWAMILISLGVAVQLGRRLTEYPERFMALIRRTMPALGAIVILLAAGLTGWEAWREHRGLRAAAAEGHPNILLVILDTVRASSLSLYGYSRPTTPNLERWARGGVVFEEAIAPAPWTLPSHATMFTGHWPHELSVRWHAPLDGRYRTLAESLRDRGYVTAGFVANHYYATRETGLQRGFLHYEALPRDAVQILRSSLLGQVVESMIRHHRYHYVPERNTHLKQAGEIRQSFLAWLTRAEPRRWFAFLNFIDAHRPYAPPKPWDERLTVGRQQVDRYDQSLAYLDNQLAGLLADLERRGQLGNTLVIVTSDHGEQFGNHGLFGHGNGLYRRLVRVPLILWWPGKVPAGVRVAHPVTLRDLPRTILDLLGEDDPAFRGTSLRETWQPDGNYPDTVFTEVEQTIHRPRAPAFHGPMQSLLTREMHYIRRGDGWEQLFDLTRDPAEYVNVADSVGYGRSLDAFRRALGAYYPGADTLSYRGSRPGSVMAPALP